MLSKNITKVNKIAVVSLLLFAIITITRIINHVPFIDEAHAWTLAENLGFFELINEVKNEGHFFLWQLILFPFAKLHLYPYSMQAINWIFCFIALILFWWKAPFNNVVKILVTFSFPFLGCYGVIARCYSLGIMFLFLLAILFDKKLKYPKTYALLLVLAANSSVMALIGASAFGFLFLYDLFKQKQLTKKDNILVGVILSIGAWLILYQLFNMDYFTQISSNRRPHISIRVFRNVFAYDNLFVNLSMLALLSLPVLKFLWSKKFATFFFSYTYFLLLAFTTAVYGGYFWHSYFFYIYLIITLWLSYNPENKELIQKLAVGALGVVAFILIFHGPTKSEHFWVFEGVGVKAKKFLAIVQADEVLRNAQIIQNDGLLQEVRPYFLKHNLKIRTHCSNTVVSDYSLINGDNKFCLVKRTIEQAKKEPETIKKIVESSPLPTYTYVDTVDYVTDRTFYNFPNNGYSIYIEKYKCYDRYCFWKVEVRR